jgi:MoxR-like ATPase
MTYRGTSEPLEDNYRLPLPPGPPWRAFGPAPETAPQDWPLSDGAGHAYLADEQVAKKVTMAMYLRRPLLVTGRPGVGKSSLAHSIARELRLGPVLHWAINSRSTLRDGLYRYDAIGRLQEARLAEAEQERGDDAAVPAIGRFVRLGPLGTALLPSTRPRVLLIDEFDKSDIDLPNDLLDVFETGAFEIPELSRLPEDQDRVEVMTMDRGGTATVERGHVRCHEFPVVVLTSNNERGFPAAFKRRCLPVDIEPPDETKLEEIIRAHLGEDAVEVGEALVEEFHERARKGELATDQLLNAIHVLSEGLMPGGWTVNDLAEALLPYLRPR